MQFNKGRFNSGKQKSDSHPEAFSHCSLVERLPVHLDDDLVQGPSLADGVVPVAGGLLNRKAVQLEVGPRIDSEI